jgi:enoyl-CoA hydratase/carnithine racemase
MDESPEVVLIDKVPLKVANQYVGLVTLNRPEEMNPLNWATVKELRKALETLSTDKGVRVIAITGAGRAFSAGGDLKAYMYLYRHETEYRGFLHDMRVTFDSIATLPQPVIALINGYCIAGGIELMEACDFAYAAKSAKIGDGHPNFGQIGGAGGNVRLPRWVSPPRARELLFTGKLLTADQALEWGLVNRVVPDDKLLDAGLEFANVIAEKSPLGTRLTKKICNLSLNMSLEDALHMEIQENVHYCVSGYDSYEGLLAFDENRPPKFEGR